LELGAKKVTKQKEQIACAFFFRRTHERGKTQQRGNFMGSDATFLRMQHGRFCSLLQYN
jgi:hypothetical protein